ncbi:hypothetical protein [Pontibacter sp. G13]|nr:hypothetical protein [Pontibacter sp. G13]WNJ19616.1 hypothetical protein RJD25_03935 [Pontibacter sp. G13]
MILMRLDRHTEARESFVAYRKALLQLNDDPMALQHANLMIRVCDRKTE